MRNSEDDNKLLASLAVFRELYNSEKDVYGIIAVFLNDLIGTNNLYSFNLNEITSKLNSTYEFNIPNAVVKTSLGRLDFIEKTRTDYVVNDVSKIRIVDIDEKQSTIASNNEAIIEDLFNFIENTKRVSLSPFDKETISHSFCSFLLDEHNGNDYIEFITAFILENEENEGFKNQLNLIREGVILYSGIKFNHNLNDLGTWRTELTVFIETEILFHIAGYNGELYQCLAADFLSYVQEINQKAQKKLIRLKYFQDVKIEVENFFAKGRYLLEGNERPNPKVTAMVSILNGCKKPSDILERKSDFYTLLQQNSIEEDRYNNYFAEENHRYNRVNSEILDKVSHELDKDAEEYLKFLNYISILRGDAKANNFENIKVILLSGNSTTLKVAWNDLLKEDGDIPLATHLSFITNKLWFKLNKGFGKNVMPRSFDIITKAQILLSKVLNDSVGEKFTELNAEFKQGRLTEEQAKARIIDLRNQVRKPEDLKNDIIKDVLSTITEDTLDKFIQEQSYFKNKAEEQVQVNIRLQEELENKKDIEHKYITAKQEILDSKLLAKTSLQQRKEGLDKISERKYNLFKLGFAFSIIIYYGVLVESIFYWGWDIMEKYTYIFSLLPVVASALYLLHYQKDINPINYLEQLKNSISNKNYIKDQFDVNTINQLDGEIVDIQNEIASLKGRV